MSWRAAAFVVGTLVTVALLPVATSRNEQAAGHQATPWRGPLPTRVTMEELNRTAAAVAERMSGPRHDEETAPGGTAVDQHERARGNVLHAEPPYGFQGILPRVQPLTLSFTAYVGNGVPDTMGAVGPSQFLLVINNRIRTFDTRTGNQDGVIDLSLADFFRPAGPGSYDPNVRYDRRADKWIVGALSTPGTSNGSNRLMFGISDTGRLSRTTRWTFHQFQFDEAEPAGAPGCSADFPYWGEDALALYILTAAFRCPDGARGGGALFVIRKDSLFGSGPIVVSTFRNPQLEGAAPADDPESGGGTGYFVSERNLCRVVNAGDAPRLLPCVPISGTRLFNPWNGGVRHRGNIEESGTPGDSAGRIHMPVGRGKTPIVRRGHAWYVMTLPVDNTGQFYYNDELARNTRLGMAWLDIVDIDSDRPRLAASGRVFQPSQGNGVDQRNYWMPSLAISGQGHMMIGASAAGINEYINAVAVGRLASDPPGMFRDPEVYTAASAAYNVNDNRVLGMRRWGDYTHTLVDPCDDMTMWTVQQYTAEADKWGIAVARMAAPPPVTPTSAAPAAIPSGHDGVEVQLSGSVVNGSGFFDPGPGFQCRLRVEVPGATVNAVRLANPTTLSVVLSTRGLPPGPLSITVTNPDGQHVVATDLVRVQ